MYSNTVMPRVCAVQERTNERLMENASVLTLTCDGKTDIAKRNVTNWMLCDTTGTCILYDFNAGSPAKNGTAICKELMEMGESVKGKTQATLNFVSDSAGSYVKARKLLKKERKSPFMFVGPCLAHQSNLILKVCVATKLQIIF